MKDDTKIQKGFLGLFGMLLVMDFLAQLATTAGLAELQPLIGLWFGPLDDIFYGMAGVQALYYLIDPGAKTRDGVLMSTTATVKKIATLLGKPGDGRANLRQGFFTGSLRAIALLGTGLMLALLANGLTSSLAASTLLVLLQRHFSYLLPVALIVGMGLLWAKRSSPPQVWSSAMLVGFGVLLVSMAVDGRWANHVHHVLAAISSLQAWGAALCWIAAGASFPFAALRVPAGQPQDDRLEAATP